MLFVRTRITVELVFLLVLSTLYLKTNARENDEKRENTNKITDRWRRFAQKKARSASFAVLPQYLYSRQTVPVRLASVPAGPYRLLGARRLNNVASLAASPGIRRTYLPAVASIPRVQYPAIVQQAAAPRYVIPYRVQPSAPVATTNDIFAKHYNEKYNTLPSISTADVANQDGASLTKKVEEKHMVLGDEFDNLMDSLDGPCAKNPCKHDAKCRMTRGGSSYFCVCTRGYKGKHCEDKNPCYPNPCDNNGECTLTRAGFECSCPRGFKGKTCEQRSKCEPNPCHNDGMCNELKNGAFECTCKKGYFGDKCQVTKKGCEPNPCHNEARCTEVGGDGGYQCACMDSYSGKNCEIMENKCQINPCKNGGSCLSTMTSQGYECSCPQGYRGQNCQDHSGCDLTSCGNGGTCYETEFGVRCICKNGYSGDTCQVRKLCDADTCQNNGKCIEHANGFYCKCSDGYRGKTCEEMDRCRPNPCLHNGECVQSDTGYICKCRPQYQGENCEVQNPCSENPCKNGGQCLSTSIGGEYQCQCFGGYLGKNCEEHDACEVNPCENNGVCRRNGNGFICDCKEGYRGETCQRSNPCRLNPCQNGGSCQQTNDHDYVCLCHKDFKGLHCEAKKPCRLNPCLNDGVCEENEDDFKCSCRRGYKGRKCDEIDECVLNPCKNGGRCTSISHSASNGRRYSCECINNYYGDNCQERSPCHPNPCANNGQCASMNGGFVCQCMAGFKGDRCQEINRCSPNPCQHDGSCTEVIGGTGYACKCAYGYKGGDCEHKDYCHPNPCDHDGQCTPLDDGEGFQCKCSSGYRGQRCSEVDPCQPNPCHHKSQCIVLPGFGPSHECNCTIGWSGETCQKREICQPNPCQFGTKCMETGEDSYSCVKSMCHPNPCQNDGKCINVNENNFQCACSEQYEGTICEVPRRLPVALPHVPKAPAPPSPASYRQPERAGANNVPTYTRNQMVPTPPSINELRRPLNIPMNEIASCSPLLCQNGGVCIQEAGRPIRCKCKPRYTGETCETSKCTNDPCRNGGTCVPIEKEPGFVCKCRDGLTGPMCSRKPCEPNPCKNGGDCVVFYSVYLCKCKPGYTGKLCEGSSPPQTPMAITGEVRDKGNGQNMETIMDNQSSACVSSPCENEARCLDSAEGDFQCICSQDFSGPRCEDKGAYKYSSAPKFFPGENEECKHCDANARCVNGHCICRNGYVGDGLECWKQTQRDKQWSCDTNPCQNGGTCKPGISRCVCRLGFTGQYCEDFRPPVVHLTFDQITDGNKVLDDSGNGNDAGVFNGFQIAKGGKCKNAGNLLGGDVLFDGANFKGIPREAITISVWLKLTTTRGIQSIFDTIGSHSSHKDGQYHFEIDDGRVRWFHRNERKQTVFSVVTDDSVVDENEWVLVTGTYSAKQHRSRVYVNGDMMKENSVQQLLLSGDWGAKAGIGKHKHTYGTRVLRGMVDEFYIFPSELSRLQILVLMKHCKIYYNHVPQVLKNSQPETFTELPPVVTMALGPVAQYTSPPSQRMTSPQYARKTSSGPYEYVKPTASAQAMWPAPGQVYAQQNGPANQPGTSPYTTPVAQQGFQRSQTSTQLKSPGTAVNTRPVYQFVQPPIKQYAPGFSDTITQAQVNGRPQYQNIPTHSPPPARYQNVPIHSPPPARYQNVPTHSPPPATYQNVPTHSPPPATYQNVPIHSPPPATYQGYNTPRYPTKPKSSQYGDYGSATKPHSRTQTPGNAYVQNELQPRNGQQTGVGRMQVSQSPPTSVTGYPASYQSSQMPSARTYKTYAPTSSGQGYANYQAPKTSWEASNKAPVEGTARNSQPENVGASYTRQNRPVAPPQPYQGVKANSGYNNVQHSYLPQADSKVQYNKITNTPEYQRYTSDQSKAWQINHVTSTGKAKPVSYITNPWSQNGNTRSNVNNNNNRAYKNANIAYKPHTYGSTNTVDQSEVHSPATSSSLYSTPTNSYQQTGVNGAQRQGIQQPNSASSSLYSTPTTNSYQQTGVNSAQRQGIPQQNSVPTTNTYQQNPGANGVQRQGIQQPNLASSSSYNTPTTNSFQQTPPGISGAQRQSTPQPNSASFPAQRQAIQHANSPSASLYNKPPTTNTYQQAPSGVNGVQRQETPQQNSVPTTNTYQQSTDANGAQRQGIQQPNSGSSSSYNTPTTNNYQQTLSSVGGAQRQKTPQPNSATTIKSTQPALARAQNMAITVPSGQLNKPISNQLDRYGQYPDNGEQYARSRVQNNNKQSPVAAYGSNYATPAPMQQGTTYPTQSGTGSTAQYGARQWNSYVPKTKKSTVGRRPTYNTAYTVRRGRQWRRTNNSTPNQHLVQRLAREKVTPSLSRTGTLAKSIAVDIPNIYKRTITKDRHTAPRALS